MINLTSCDDIKITDIFIMRPVSYCEVVTTNS
jgi:hypothetical protein